MMPANSGIAGSVILGVMLASTLSLAGTAAARSGSFGFGHARYGWASAARPSWSHAYPSHAPVSRPSDAGRRWSQPSSTLPRQGASYAGTPRNTSWDAGSREPRRDYRQSETGNRYAHDYRQFHADSRHAQGSDRATARTPVPAQPASYPNAPYYAGATAAGYGTMASDSAFSAAGLLAQIASAFVQDMLDGEMYGADPTDAGAGPDSGYNDGYDGPSGYDDPAR